LEVTRPKLKVGPPASSGCEWTQNYISLTFGSAQIIRVKKTVPTLNEAQRISMATISFFVCLGK
jgi:hypothetical protein